MKVLSPDLIKGPWQSGEDEIIIKCKGGGMKKWSEIAKCIPGRVGKQVANALFLRLLSCLLHSAEKGG